MSGRLWIFACAVLCSSLMLSCGDDSGDKKTTPTDQTQTPTDQTQTPTDQTPTQTPTDQTPTQTPTNVEYGACSLANALGGTESCSGGTCVFPNMSDCSNSYLCGIFQNSTPFCTHRCVPSAAQCASGNCACPQGINCVTQCPNGAACSEWVSGSAIYYCLPADKGVVTTPTKPDPVNPTPTDPAPTDPKPTDPAPTDPAPTDPTPTNPTPSTPVVGHKVGDSCDPDKTGSVCSGTNVLECDEDTGKFILKGICETDHTCVETADVVDCFKPCTAADVKKTTPVCYDVISMIGECQAYGGGYYYLPDDTKDMMLCSSGCENGECIKNVADEGSPCSESTFKQRCEGSTRVFCEDTLSHKVSTYDCNDGDTHYCMIDGNNEADCVSKCSTPGPMYTCEDYEGQTDIYDMYVFECEKGADGNLYKVWKETKEQCGKSCNTTTGVCK